MILVVGGVGFLGYHVAAEAVEQGHRVCVVARRPSIARRRAIARLLRGMGVEVIAGDEVDSELVASAARRCEPRLVVYAAGAMAGGTRAWEAHVGVWREVLEALRGLESLELAVYVSAATVSPCTATPREDEAAPDRAAGLTSFTRTKAEGEALGLAYARDYGLPVAIVRPVLMFGEYAGHAEHKIIAAAARLGIAVDAAVDAVPARDVARAILFLWRSSGRARSRWFYVVRPEGFTLAQLAETIACRGRRCLRLSAPLRALARLALALGRPARLAVLGEWLRCGWRFRPEGLLGLGFNEWTDLAREVERYAAWLGLGGEPPKEPRNVG